MPLARLPKPAGMAALVLALAGPVPAFAQVGTDPGDGCDDVTSYGQVIERKKPGNKPVYAVPQTMCPDLPGSAGGINPDINVYMDLSRRPRGGGVQGDGNGGDPGIGVGVGLGNSRPGGRLGFPPDGSPYGPPRW
ncbi:hypothetical protein QNA08_12570 [Chelatococcus sp. SYSU_G07232]|uniref:Uncharacterized protein n=1 Tax=Chelatococcus albus TaxID=3047466 RepID=A0ABT7AKC8_9HYPH|nr:hypothetical protein [Chelatococcus sp. SYSU_G07232]MDJ1159071.1 hypothetical protein [Chelatococcus sp. SYSU_G07232]